MAKVCRRWLSGTGHGVVSWERGGSMIYSGWFWGGLCQKSNTSAQQREHEAGLKDKSVGGTCLDGRWGLRSGGNHDNRSLNRGGTAGRLLGGYCPAGLVVVVPGRGGGDGRVGLGPLMTGAFRRGRVALGDGDRLGHGRRRGGGGVLLAHDHGNGRGQNGEDALELHFDGVQNSMHGRYVCWVTDARDRSEAGAAVFFVGGLKAKVVRSTTVPARFLSVE
jgi:hypothetical protein